MSLSLARNVAIAGWISLMIPGVTQAQDINAIIAEDIESALTAPPAAENTAADRINEIIQLEIPSAADGPRELSIYAGQTIDLPVHFPFDSADITVDAETVLIQLGIALGRPGLQQSRFLIAGHTDAKGSAEYNTRLSHARAQAVKTYLVTRFALSPDLLVIAGFGESRLHDPSNPTAAINRRVEIAVIAN